MFPLRFWARHQSQSVVGRFIGAHSLPLMTPSCTVALRECNSIGNNQAIVANNNKIVNFSRSGAAAASFRFGTVCGAVADAEHEVHFSTSARKVESMRFCSDGEATKQKQETQQQHPAPTLSAEPDIVKIKEKNSAASVHPTEASVMEALEKTCEHFFHSYTQNADRFGFTRFAPELFADLRSRAEDGIKYETRVPLNPKFPLGSELFLWVRKTGKPTENDLIAFLGGFRLWQHTSPTEAPSRRRARVAKRNPTPRKRSASRF